MKVKPISGYGRGNLKMSHPMFKMKEKRMGAA
jgi:hypothetical protein